MTCPEMLKYWTCVIILLKNSKKIRVKKQSSLTIYKENKNIRIDFLHKGPKNGTFRKISLSIICWDRLT